MELLRNLFEGYPNLWGGGVAHSVLILSLVITFGIMLGKLKVAGISLGVTWILFVGIVFGHFDMNLDEHLLHFLKEFGLILFVYSIGLQVGPGFFSAFKKGGLTLNMVAMLSVFLSVVITIVLHFATGIPITTMVGILSGAVTNTPGLGAAQQANSDLNGVDAPEIALGYAVAYPLGVVGCILALLALKIFMRINTQKEEEDAEHGLGHLQELTVRPISVEIRNEAIDGKRRTHPGRCEQLGRLCLHLLSEHHCVGCHSADIRHSGSVCRWGMLLSGAHRLYLHGKGAEPHVHHRSGRGKDRDPRGGGQGGTGRCLYA